MTEATKTKTISINGRECQVRDITFDWVHSSRTDVTESWDKWLYGTTPEQLIDGFQSPEDAICHFLTDVINNNPFGLSKEELEDVETRADHIATLLLAYCQDRLQAKD